MLTGAPAAVAAVKWGKGQAWDFDRNQMVTWSWKEMIAQLDADSMQIVVGGWAEGGLVGCYFAPRPNSYDHKRHSKLRQEGRPQKDVRLPVWDFVVERANGTAVRLHPQRTTTKVETFELEGPAESIPPPAKGYGESMGRGTYKLYKVMNTRAQLRFDANKGWNLPPSKNQG